MGTFMTLSDEQCERYGRLLYDTWQEQDKRDWGFTDDQIVPWEQLRSGRPADFAEAAEAVAEAAIADTLARVEALMLDDRFEFFGVNQSFPGIYGWYGPDDETEFYYSLAELLAAHGGEG